MLYALRKIEGSPVLWACEIQGRPLNPKRPKSWRSGKKKTVTGDLGTKNNQNQVFIKIKFFPVYQYSPFSAILTTWMKRI